MIPTATQVFDAGDTQAVGSDALLFQVLSIWKDDATDAWSDQKLFRGSQEHPVSYRRKAKRHAS